MVRIRVKKAKQLAFLARNNLFKHCLNNRHNNRDLGMLDDALLKSNFGKVQSINTNKWQVTIIIELFPRVAHPVHFRTGQDPDPANQNLKKQIWILLALTYLTNSNM